MQHKTALQDTGASVPTAGSGKSNCVLSGV